MLVVTVEGGNLVPLILNMMYFLTLGFSQYYEVVLPLAILVQIVAVGIEEENVVAVAIPGWSEGLSKQVNYPCNPNSNPNYPHH